jgi:mycothiol synthase
MRPPWHEKPGAEAGRRPYPADVDVELRPLGNEDIPALARLLAAAEEVDRTGEHYSEADLVEEFANPDIELGKDIVGAFDGRDLVGYFSVYPRAQDGAQQKVHLEGSVRPERRGQGIGTRLVEAMLVRASEVHAERHPELPAKLMLTAPSGKKSQESLLVDFGFVAERWNFVMRARLDQVAPPGPAPTGLEVRRYETSYAGAMHAAHNDAFLDHPNFTPWTDVMWKQWVTGSRNFRPELSFVVVASDDPHRVVAYLQTNEYDAYFEATGKREAYVAKVGTLREFRRRGLAGVLLGHALAAYRDAGFDEASLDVDSENPTGALGLYRRAGFEVESRWTNYALVQEPLVG